MTRLPTPGGDNDTWGNILNDFLGVEHNADGTLKKAADITQAKAKADSAVQPGDLATVATTGSYTDLTNKPAAATIPDATTTSKGAVQLAGDLGGSNDAAAPVISSGAITDAKVSATAAIAQSKIANLTADLAAKANTTDIPTTPADIGAQPAGTYLESVVAGTGAAVDTTDPANPVVNVTVTQRPLTFGTTAPASPNVGDLWGDQS